MAALEAKAYAKINLTLEILGKRQDGFHEIVSIMQTVSLADHITIYPSEQLTLNCDVAEINNRCNLALVAANLLRERFGISMGANINIEKRIPLSSGLGGGSSDAATVLKLLWQLWEIQDSEERLFEVAAEIGSDVPFFLRGGTASVRGRGELVRSLPDLDKQWFLLLVPKVNLPNKTPFMYSKIDDSHFTSGGLSRKLEARVWGGGDVPDELLFNVFHIVAETSIGQVQVGVELLNKIGCRSAILSGSGPALFARIANLESARAIQILLEHKYRVDAIIAESVPLGGLNS